MRRDFVVGCWFFFLYCEASLCMVRDGLVRLLLHVLLLFCMLDTPLSSLANFDSTITLLLYRLRRCITIAYLLLLRPRLLRRLTSSLGYLCVSTAPCSFRQFASHVSCPHRWRRRRLRLLHQLRSVLRLSHLVRIWAACQMHR